MIGGGFLQVLALAMLAVDPAWLTVGYVMTAMALSGIAKDLNKTWAHRDPPFRAHCARSQESLGRSQDFFKMLGSENPFRPAQQGVDVGGLDPLSDGGVGGAEFEGDLA
jgi:hypothetical protein